MEANKKNEYPLFPELQEGGAEEAQALIEKFRDKLKIEAANVMSSVMDEFYHDLVPHIESDAWTNYRNELMDGLRNYRNRKIQGEHDFKEIRQAIFREFKDEIIKDLDQDHLEAIESLKEQIEFLQRCRQ
ncbi:hypothetical protein DRH13_04370 [Candidatus Woesebacteria bacterium]|nr:MAG: hypothetical protein DRH13_04370 [Candidatus Woesebacteria bacterium]